MKLSLAEFKKIRTLHWRMQAIGDKVYYTVSTQIETQLFWYDFIRYIFVPRFKKQNMINTISNFDQSQSVYITSDLELQLADPVMNLIFYYEENRTLPFKFFFPISQFIVLVIGITIIIITMLTNVLFDTNLHFSQTYII